MHAQLLDYYTAHPALFPKVASYMSAGAAACPVCVMTANRLVTCRTVDGNGHSVSNTCPLPPSLPPSLPVPQLCDIMKQKLLLSSEYTVDFCEAVSFIEFLSDNMEAAANTFAGNHDCGGSALS